jgi:2-keto-4-pentenoate hydratase
MDQAAVERAAETIARWRLGGTPIGELPTAIRPATEEDGYAVQAALHRRLEKAGRGPLGGFKIGCTTPVMQEYLKIPQPCAGGVFAATVHEREVEVEAAKYLKLGVECEIAVRLKRDLGAGASGELADAVDAVMAAMELVEDRYEDYGQLGIYPLIADDFFNAGAVLGAPRSLDGAGNLTTVRGAMRINGEVVGRGRGADVMGHPLTALAWVARRYAELGWTLPAGSFVLLGSVVQTHWVAAGDHVVCEVERLGRTLLEVK